MKLQITPQEILDTSVSYTIAEATFREETKALIFYWAVNDVWWSVYHNFNVILRTENIDEAAEAYNEITLMGSEDEEEEKGNKGTDTVE